MIKNEVDTEELLERLEKIRLDRGKSKSDFAKKFDVTRSTYSTWIQGHRKPNDVNIYKIKKFVDRNYGELVVDRMGKKMEKHGRVKVTPLPVILYIELTEEEDEVLNNLNQETVEEIDEKARAAAVEAAQDTYRELIKKEM